MPDPPLSTVKGPFAVSQSEADRSRTMFLVEAAMESSQDRLCRRLLAELLRQMQAGKSLSEAVRCMEPMLPETLRKVFSTAENNEQLIDAMQDFGRLQAERRGLWSGLWIALAYPTLLLFASMVTLGSLRLQLSPFRSVFEEMEIQLPVFTVMMLKMNDLTLALLPAGAVFICVVLLVLFWLPLPARLYPLVYTMPGVGSLVEWSDGFKWLGTMAFLTGRNTPLPEALRLAALETPRSPVASASHILCDGVEQGASLAEMLRQMRVVPPSCIPLLAWGERNGSLAEAFALTSDMLRDRLRARMSHWIELLPPVLLLLVVSIVISVLVAVVIPMFNVMFWLL